jgi:hypothetical protein
MKEQKRIIVWHWGCLLVGLASAVAGAIWLLVVDRLLFPEKLTLATSFGLAFFLPVLFAIAWPKRSVAQRIVGIAIGIVGASVGIYVLATLVALGHRH